jgi:hypothetical protein
MVLLGPEDINSLKAILTYYQNVNFRQRREKEIMKGSLVWKFNLEVHLLKSKGRTRKEIGRSQWSKRGKKRKAVLCLECCSSICSPLEGTWFPVPP